MLLKYVMTNNQFSKMKYSYMHDLQGYLFLCARKTFRYFAKSIKKLRYINFSELSRKCDPGASMIFLFL